MIYTPSQVHTPLTNPIYKHQHHQQPHPGPGGAAAETAALADKAHQLFAAPVDIMIPAGNTPATRIKFWEAAAQVIMNVLMCVYVCVRDWFVVGVAPRHVRVW